MPGPADFFTQRWRAEVPIRTLFWRDLVLVGTSINVLFTGVALGLAASGGSIALAAGLHFMPLPYNLFLTVAVWRATSAGPWRWAALLWLAAVTLV